RMPNLRINQFIHLQLALRIKLNSRVQSRSSAKYRQFARIYARNLVAPLVLPKMPINPFNFKKIPTFHAPPPPAFAPGTCRDLWGLAEYPLSHLTLEVGHNGARQIAFGLIGKRRSGGFISSIGELRLARQVAQPAIRVAEVKGVGERRLAA